MQVGVHLSSFTLPGGPAAIGPTLAAVGRAADDAGVANLSLMDHFFRLDMIGGVDAERKLAVLRQHCDREGTDYDRMRTTVLHPARLRPVADGAEALADELAPYAALGVSEVHLVVADADRVRHVRNPDEHVVPRLAAL